MSSISERLEKQAETLFNNLAGWELKAMRRIGERIKSIGSLSMADLQAINNAVWVKQDFKTIMKELADLTERDAAEVERIYSQMIEEQHEENRRLYDYRGKEFAPFEDNRQLKAIVRAFARTTAESMIGLSMSKAKRIGFVDKNNNFIAFEKDYKKVLDKAAMSVTTGTGDFNSEMRDALKELGGSGLRVDYGGGVTRRLDSMVRQNILWGAKQVSVEYSELIGEELRCDGIEIDWHTNPRPSHEFMQGRQYSLEGEKTVNGVTYEGADKALEALSDYGCLHFKTPIILGVSEPRFAPKELERLNRENAKQIEIDGVTKSGYEWKQTMRRLEAETRKTKEQMAILKASGDKEGVRQLRDKLNAINEKYYKVAKASGIKAQPQRMSIVKGNTGKIVDNAAKSGIINYAKGVDIFNDYGAPEHAKITADSILRELETSPIGKEAVKYMQESGIRPRLIYEKQLHANRGLQTGDDIQIFVANVKHDKDAAQAVIHELTHRKYDMGNCQWAEVNCFLAERMHYTGKVMLSDSEKKMIIKRVKEAYTNLQWKRGGYFNGKKF